MSDTPRTDAVNKYLRTRTPYSNLRTRDDYTKTDYEVWMDHGSDIERKLNTAHESLLYARTIHIQKQIALDKANHRIKRLEEAGNEMHRYITVTRGLLPECTNDWRKAKEETKQ